VRPSGSRAPGRRLGSRRRRSTEAGRRGIQSRLARSWGSSPAAQSRRSPTVEQNRRDPVLVRGRVNTARRSLEGQRETRRPSGTSYRTVVTMSKSILIWSFTLTVPVPARKSILSNSGAAAMIAGLLRTFAARVDCAALAGFFVIAIEGRRSCQNFGRSPRQRRSWDGG
jgi:hypothetical protein